MAPSSAAAFAFEPYWRVILRFAAMAFRRPSSRIVKTTVAPVCSPTAVSVALIVIASAETCSAAASLRRRAAFFEPSRRRRANNRANSEPSRRRRRSSVSTSALEAKTIDHVTVYERVRGTIPLVGHAGFAAGGHVEGLCATRQVRCLVFQWSLMAPKRSGQGGDDAPATCGVAVVHPFFVAQQSSFSL